MSNVSFGQLSFPSESAMDYFDSKNISPWWPENAKSAFVIKKVLASDNWNDDTSYYEFDKNNRISLVAKNRFYNNELTKDTIIYTYNSEGLWKSKISLFDTSQRSFKYDDINRITRITINGSPQFTFKYSGDNSNPSIVNFSSTYWNEYKYDSLYRISEIHKFKDSVLAEIHKYIHIDRKVEIFRISDIENIYNDTITIYMNENNNVMKQIYKTNDFNKNGPKPVYAINSYRYDNGKVVSMTDCLTNDASTGFTDYIYDEFGNLKEIISYTKNGRKKTRHYMYSIEFK